MKPCDFFISLKPCQLFAHIFPAVRLYLSDGFCLVYLPIEIGKHLLVTYGSECSQSLLRIYFASFLFQSFFHHHEYSLVDAVIEFGSVSVESDFDDAERTLFLFGGAERRVGLACLMANLQGVYHSSWILLIDDSPVLRVELVQLFNECFESFLSSRSFIQVRMSSRTVGMSSMPLQTASMYIMLPPVRRAVSCWVKMSFAGVSSRQPHTWLHCNNPRCDGCLRNNAALFFAVLG